VTAYTILLAAHDRLEFLKEAVASALAQQGPRFEVLVVDDGSGPETARWLDEVAHGDVRLRVVHQRNQGVGAARANGVAAAAHEFVAILDSDDVFRPDALARIDALFSAHPDTDLVYCDHDQLLPDGRVEVTRYPIFASNAALLRATLLRPRVPFKHSGMTYRKAVALALGSYDTAIGIKIDIDFFLRFVVAGRCVRHLPGGPAVSFRTHNESMSRKRGQGIRAWWTIIDRYGPKSALARLATKGVRTTWELLKAVYTALFWTERRSASSRAAACDARNRPRA
jgi:glycosyltransferase involved in cell wall biosynthesis